MRTVVIALPRNVMSASVTCTDRRMTAASSALSIPALYSSASPCCVLFIHILMLSFLWNFLLLTSAFLQASHSLPSCLPSEGILLSVPPSVPSHSSQHNSTAGRVCVVCVHMSKEHPKSTQSTRCALHICISCESVWGEGYSQSKKGANLQILPCSWGQTVSWLQTSSSSFSSFHLVISDAFII